MRWAGLLLGRLDMRARLASRPCIRSRADAIVRAVGLCVAAIGLAARRRGRSLRHVPLLRRSMRLGKCLFMLEIVVS